MGAAVPIIAVAASVAGTAASIKARNDQVSAQNAAIDSQISANKQFERIRNIQNEAQRNIIEQEARNDKIARKTQFKAETAQIRLNQLQNEGQAAIQTKRLKLANREAANQANVASNQITGQLDQANQAVDENEIATLNQLSDALASIQDPSGELANLKAQIDNSVAEAIAVNGSRGRSSSTLRSSANNSVIQQALQSLQSTGSIDAEVAQELANSNEFSDIVRQINNSAAGLQQSALGNQLQSIRNRNDLSIRTTQKNAANLSKQLKGANRLANIDNAIGNKQAQINKQISLGSLITGRQLQRTQSAAQVAQLNSQRASPVGALQSISAIGGQIAPLIGSLTAQQSLQPVTFDKGPQQPLLLSKGPGVPLSASIGGSLAGKAIQ